MPSNQATSLFSETLQLLVQTRLLIGNGQETREGAAALFGMDVKDLAQGVKLSEFSKTWMLGRI